MTLTPGEFMRRFLLHVLPSGFHYIQHYGLLANGACKSGLPLTHQLLQVSPQQPVTPDVENTAQTQPEPRTTPAFVCRHCGKAMVILQCFVRVQAIRAAPS